MVSLLSSPRVSPSSARGPGEPQPVRVRPELLVLLVPGLVRVLDQEVEVVVEVHEVVVQDVVVGVVAAVEVAVAQGGVAVQVGASGKGNGDRLFGR